jgi:AcrR family transcriptional regulator
MTQTPATASAPVRAPRRTQSERSEAMRKRLLAATLQSLAEDGYTGSTLSSIVRRAGVSRGAQVHHYPNKQALMLDAAADLLRRTYRALGELMLSIAEEDDRLRSLVETVWRRLFTSQLHRAYNELLLESQRDPALAEALQKLLLRQVEVFSVAVDHYFVAAPGSTVEPTAIFVQLCALMHGFASHAHLLLTHEQVPEQLRAWIEQASTHMHARKGVHSAPPRPPHWDRK